MTQDCKSHHNQNFSPKFTSVSKTSRQKKLPILCKCLGMFYIGTKVAEYVKIVDATG